MSKDRNCLSCDNYKDEYCSVVDMKPYYPERGCDYFEARMSNIQEICDKVKDLSERVENIEKHIKEEKEEEIKKLKAEIDYAKFCCALSDMMSDSRRGKK